MVGHFLRLAALTIALKSGLELILLSDRRQNHGPDFD